MNENKKGKYVKYAIGEILLVVIGILMALQINNWNEQRKLKAIELNLLSDIANDLRESKIELEDVESYNLETVTAFENITNHLINDLPYSQSLDSSFFTLRYWSSPYLTYTAYETLKTKGLDLIKNDSLKKRIVKMYESLFAYIIKDYDRTEWVMAQTIVYPLTAANIRRINDNIAKPNDYNALKANEEFINMLYEIKDLRTKGVNKIKDISISVGNLITDIENEIKERQ